jgi:hypothetical protein
MGQDLERVTVWWVALRETWYLIGLKINCFWCALTTK